MLPPVELEAAADRDEASAVRALHPVMDPAQQATALRIDELVQGARARASKAPISTPSCRSSASRTRKASR
ncbi:MAG: hypothetical protein U1F11_10555 [Steroidobacteraceae bacterium]